LEEIIHFFLSWTILSGEKSSVRAGKESPRSETSPIRRGQIETLDLRQVKFDSSKFSIQLFFKKTIFLCRNEENREKTETEREASAKRTILNVI